MKPVDIKLYNKTKKNIYKKYPKHSAYRSGILVKTYKKKFKEKYGNKKPYTGKKTQKKGLSRWFNEKWVNQRGEVGYKYKSDIYRPSIRITKKTPVTHRELTKRQTKRARKEKYKTGRVKKFKKGGGITTSKIKPPIEPKNNTKKIKHVNFNDDPVSETWSQSPRDEDEFYYPVEKSGTNSRTRKQKLQNKRTRLAAIIKYDNRRRHEDLVDMALGKIPLKGGRKTQKRKTNGEIVFKDYPEFKPNLTPREIFKLGSFGGTYWRPIKSKFFKNELKNKHKNYPKSWWNGIPEENLSSKECDIKKNKYGVRVGTSLKFWENKNWMRKSQPYGWVQWYCDFYLGKRGPDDERQIKRWLGLAGENGRFRKYLITLIKKNKKNYNDYDISPKIRQTLQHWAYKLTKKDFEKK